MTSREDTKSYLSKREIPQLFESLMTGLMYHKPDNHVDYLKQCLQDLEGSNPSDIKWHMFVDAGKQSAPLPPINKSNVEKKPPPVIDQPILEMKKTSPLPPIAAAPSQLDDKETLKYIFILGGPGSGKGEQSKRIAERFQGLALISVGELLRSQAAQLQASDENWRVLSGLIKEGKLVSDETAFSIVKSGVEKSTEAKSENLMGFLIEGFPRTTEQYGKFEQEFGKPHMVIYLESNADLAKLTSGLEDEQQATVANRMSYFTTTTMSFINQFQGEPDVLHKVNADRGTDEVFQDISGLIGSTFFERKETSSPKSGKDPVALNSADPLPPIPTQLTGEEDQVNHHSGEGEAETKEEVATDKDTSGQEADTSEADAARTALVEDAVKLLEPEEANTEGEQENQGGSEEAVAKDEDTAAKGEEPSGEETEAEGAREALVEEAVKLLEPVEDTVVKEEVEVTGDKGLVEEVQEEPVTKEEVEVLGDKGFVKSPEEKLKESTIIFVSGGPGCGKGTQCEKIVQDYGFTHLSAGDLLREAASAGDERGQQIVEIMKAGTLVPHEITISLLKEAMLAKVDSSQGFLIDGFPRALDQGTAFEEQVAEGKLMLFFDVSDETLKSRLLKRAETSGREDDNEETIGKRLETFHSVTTPVAKHFAAKNKLGKVPAESSPEEVYAEVQRVFGEFNVCKPGTAIDDTGLTELKDKKIIFVIGGPGSGKGTQCGKIAERYGFTHLSSGDLLRAEVASGSKRGQELAAIMEKGELVSLDVVLALIKEKMISESSVSKGYLIDGYPREIEQGVAFEEKIGECVFALYFEVSDDSMTARLLNRAKTSGRADDNEETIEKRLETFHTITQPVVDHYKNLEKLKLISAESGPDEVFSEVVKLFSDSGLVSPNGNAATAPEPAEQKQMNFTFVVGGPGSGKKEVAKSVASKKDAIYISAGDLIRSEVEKDPEGNKEMADALSIGDIVHVTRIMSLIKEAVAEFKDSREFVIEGFPRTAEQAETFSKEYDAKHKVIVLSGTQEELEQNVTARAETSGRADDVGDAAKKKISSFFDSVTAVVDYYKKGSDEKEKVMEVSFKDAIEDLTNVLTFVSLAAGEDPTSETPQD